MKKALFFLIFLLAGLSSLKAQQATFRSQLLNKLGTTVGYVPIDTLEVGAYDAGQYKGYPLIAEYGAEHTVIHLGLHLFHPEIKKAAQSYAYNFLERYFLELLTWKEPTSLEQKMIDDKFLITAGGLSALKEINDTTLFQMSSTEDKFYETTWLNDEGKPILSVAFPIQYELLLGMTKLELELLFEDEIRRAPQVVKPDSIDVELGLLNDSVYRTNPIQFIDLEPLNNCSYYLKKNDAFELILDTIHPDLTALNVFQNVTNCLNPIDVEQALYGFKQKKFSITIQQWMNYCKKEKMTIYGAMEELYDQSVKIYIVAHSKELAYNHLLSIIVPKQFVNSPGMALKMDVHAFVPTHNLKNLYEEYQKKQKIKWE